MRLARKVERVVRDLYDVYGYDEVQSPQLYKTSLWKRSGHWDNYRDDMFATEGYKERTLRTPAPTQLQGNSSVEEGRTACCAIDHASTPAAAEGTGEDESFGLKPMNCPGHCLIFASQERSYRDLPIRYAEFSPLHRNEASGALTGLTRVRRFHQDDAHVFCRPDQVSTEINSMLAMLTSAYDTFGFSSFELVLSTRPDSFIGDISEWDKAEAGLTEALNQSGREWELNAGDGAFYGPKIDIRLVDGQGRRHQTATIQLDFQLPRRFDLSYADPTAKDTNERAIPVMIHRAILGSVERFMAILIEQTSGWWPFWLSPRQAIILPAKTDSPELVEYAAKVQKVLSLGIHPDASPAKNVERHLQRFFVDIEQNPQGEKLGKLVRKAQLARYNYILVVGEREMETQTVNVRRREDKSAPQRLRELRAKQDEDGGGEEVGKGGQYGVKELRDMFCRLDSSHAW